MILLAIDPASNSSGYAFFEDGTLLFASKFVSSAETPLKRRIQTAIHFHQLFDQCDVVVSEEPMLQGRNNNGMNRLLGMFEFGNPEICWVHPLTMKKEIAGTGKAEKLDVAIAAGSFLKSEKEKEILAKAISEEEWDLTDAIAIGLSYFKLRGLL